MTIKQQTHTDTYDLHLRTFRNQSTACRVANILCDRPTPGITLGPNDIYVNGCDVIWRRGALKPMDQQNALKTLARNAEDQ